MGTVPEATPVFADDEDRVLEVLDEAECLDLLARAGIGRVAFTEAALPAIQPVSYRLVGAEILIPSRLGSTVATASRRAVLAFSVDDVDLPDRTGWTVTVVGPSRVISGPADVAELDRSGARPPGGAGDRCYIAIAVQLVHGRRIAVHAPLDPCTSTGTGGTTPSADVPA